MKDNSLVGQVIKIVYMSGEPQYGGKIGTVKYVDDIGQMHGTWGGCAVHPEEDAFKELSGIGEIIKRVWEEAVKQYPEEVDEGVFLWASFILDHYDYYQDEIYGYAKEIGIEIDPDDCDPDNPDDTYGALVITRDVIKKLEDAGKEGK